MHMLYGKTISDLSFYSFYIRRILVKYRKFDLGKDKFKTDVF